MGNSLIRDYISSDQKIGLDNFLPLQLRVEGAIASRFGITSLALLGFVTGFAVAIAFF
jgi:hypothetical protein